MFLGNRAQQYGGGQYDGGAARGGGVDQRPAKAGSQGRGEGVESEPGQGTTPWAPQPPPAPEKTKLGVPPGT